MNISPDKKKPDIPDTTNEDPKQGKSDPQLTELDGLKKGGVDPTVNKSDKARDKDGKID